MGKKKRSSKMREALSIVSKGLKGMTTVNAMEEELFYPSIFTSFNRASGIGGIPKRKMIVIHGANSTGKSVLACGLAESLRRAHDVPIIYECEYAAEARWMNRLVLGEDTLFFMPMTLDELFAYIQTNLDNLAKGKEGGQIDSLSGCAFVIDTLTKLIPQEQWTKIMKEGYKKSFPLQANWVSTWTKIIVPQAYRSNSTFVIVLQDRQKLDAGQFGKKKKPTLGEALLYDTSIMVECTHSIPVHAGGPKSKAGPVVANQHFFKLEKNKVDGFTAQEGCFFTSTGRGDTPAGFDYAREAITEARLRGMLRTAKRNKKDFIVGVNREGDEFLKIEGGWEDMREALADETVMEVLSGQLNKDARRSEF
jgi:recombination protein RecA